MRYKILLAFVAFPCAAQAASPFDGTWDTTLSCRNTDGALGYSFEFDSRVEDGNLTGGKGEKGEPGWLEIRGPIHSDGSADLYVNGIVGAAPYAVGYRPAGSGYGYHVDAKFSGAKGTGHRVEGRPCDVVFIRKHGDE